MEHTKGEQEFLNILMSAWVAGWYAGRAGETTDGKKRVDCPEIMQRYPVQAAALDLRDACKLARHNEHKRWGEIKVVLDAAIAKAESKG